jgi:hypothetical protein
MFGLEFILLSTVWVLQSTVYMQIIILILDVWGAITAVSKCIEIANTSLVYVI